MRDLMANIVDKDKGAASGLLLHVLEVPVCLQQMLNSDEKQLGKARTLRDTRTF